MIINAFLEQKKLNAELDFAKVYVGGDNREAKVLLYNWMLLNGYPVTPSMTILQLVRILVGAVVQHFRLSGNSLVELTEGAAIVEGNNLTFVRGVHFSGNTLVLE